ncbi:disulfide bond formation protein B [Loigolactobacillus iwatensis]|uniref:disulfide bond formation protein B n=1 Tax=Loigolactobacillus iwatensis TaxID=1267156 RepID=UPI000F7ECBAF|nr:disulfide bond formation protein B [Loigolactobacillus iwatensis]
MEQKAKRNEELWGSLGFWLAIGFVGAYILVLLGSMSAQFINHDLPCPLCVLQRESMIMTAVGPAYIITASLKHELTIEKFARGYGMALVFAVFGMVAAARQTLLHIGPHDPGYGPGFLGVHFYTWSLLTFIVVVVFCGFNLIFAKQLAPGKNLILPIFGNIIVKVMFVLVVVMFIAMIFQEGFNFLLPDDPVKYQLFDLF